MYLYVKRCIDIVCSGLGLVVVFPILVVLALLIGIQMGRPIMFKQMLPGLNGKSFYMRYEFDRVSPSVDSVPGLYNIGILQLAVKENCLPWLGTGIIL
jgi:sugar transferase EpsL